MFTVRCTHTLIIKAATTQLLLQEYFYKSQESLATVIDFVDQDLEISDDEEKTTSSTHSSPQESKSGIKGRNKSEVPCKLTP